MPAPRRKVPLLVRLRGTFLTLAILLTLLLVGLYYFGRAGLQSPTNVQREDVLPAEEEEVTTLSKGFDYTQYEDDRKVFRVRGATYRADRDGLAHLEDVAIELFRREGDSFQAISKRATYNQAAAAAELSGEVHLTGPRGLELWTEELTVGEQGERVLSPVPVRFEYQGRLRGSANNMRVEIPAELILLQGNLLIQSMPDAEVPLQLSAQRGFMEQAERTLRAEGGVRLEHGGDWMECLRLIAYLADDADVLRFVRAKWQVVGELTVPPEDPASPPGRMEYSAGGLAALFDPSGREIQTLELEGGSGQPADLRSVDPATGHLRRITANLIHSGFSGQGLETVQAEGQVRMAEFAGSEPTGELVREARSERATASVDASGSISDVRLDQAVDFREAAVRITSNQARMRMNEGEAEFIGGPVQVVGERGELKAPRVLFQREQNRVHAQEGVRAVLSSPQGSAIPGPLLNSGEGPVYVDSEEAFWHRDEDLFVFRGSVRAWRGRDLLLAEEAEVNRAGDRLRASGGVKTVWHPQARQRTEADTLEVDAQRFDYDGANQRLLYKGKVKVDDGLYRMACDEAQIDLLKDGGMERLNCTGAARLEDPAQGRVVEGSRAVYDPGVEIVEVYGDPVIMKDREGSELKGRELVYRLQQGTVEFRSAKPEGSSAGESGSDETASEERP